MIIACIGFWSSFVFYNSYLPEIAAPEDRDRVSARGYMMGYIGSVLLQIVCFVLVLKSDLFGMTTAEGSQWSFLLVGVWWWGFGQMAINRLPKSKPLVDVEHTQVFTGGYRELKKVWQQLTHLPVLKKFLLSFFFYDMGVQTIMLAATLYGKSELNIPTTNLIVAILIIQLVAIPGAFVLARLSNKIGNLNTLMLTVLFWIGLCCFGYTIPRNGINQFYILAVLVGFVMGGIQSLSRSTYSKLMPETKDTTSFFSFYDVTEKLSIVFGMATFGIINELSDTMRTPIVALIVFFVLGFILLIRVPKMKIN
jgi:UMF1 family MFS transporter